MSETLAEATGLVLAPEATLKTAPGAGAWTTAQPNPGGIQGFEPLTKTVERDPLSKFATPEKGDVVGLDVELSITTDLNKDTVDLVAEAVFRCTGKHPGNKSQRLYRPSGVTSTGYTVAANGDLTNGLLVYARGFTNAANNGLKLLAGSSTTTEIKTTGLVVEASPPANATVDVVGVRGASGDITITSANYLASTILDFTTLGIQVGQWLTIGGLTASTFFGTVPSQSRARVVSVAAHLITLERWSWTVAGVDSGASKTIDIGIGSFYRNYTLDSANYAKKTLHAELEQQGPGTAGVATYTYAQGLAPTQWDVDAALESKITSMLKFVGLDIPDPVLVANRVTGPSTAYLPMAADLADTATDLKQVRLTDTTGVMSAVEVNTWKFSLNNNIKGKKVQATLGNIGHLYGKFNFSVSMEIYFNDYNAIKAARDNRGLQWDAFLNNGQYGLQFDLPNVTIRNPKRTFPANEPVMLSCDVPAFRSTTDNIAGSLTVFGYVP